MQKVVGTRAITRQNFLKPHFPKLFLSKVESEIHRYTGKLCNAGLIAAWSWGKEFNPATPAGAHPTDNHQLAVTKFSAAGEQAAGGAPWDQARRGRGQDGVLQGGPQLWGTRHPWTLVTLATQRGPPLRNSLAV